ncbi:MAG: peptidoglycan bridge formation glycyltransferase FemA/FemB family protein [Salinivirgaceae bacterium]|nr:peptidoglycan bridge formation glycyltransferase FemA/FemB family protein [Salinivirgaceae bacterium]
MLLNYFSNKEELDKLLSDNSPLFFQKHFSDYLTDNNLGSLNIFYHNETKTFLPIVFTQSRFLNIARIADIPFNGNVVDNELEKSIISDFLHFCRRESIADRVTYYLPFHTFKTYPKKSTFCNTGHLEVNLKAVEKSQIMPNLFSSKVRNMVKRAERANVFIKSGDDCFEDFFRLYSESNSRYGAIIDDYNLVKSLYNHLGEYCSCFVAYKTGLPQCSALILNNAKYGYYLYAGSDSKMEPGSSNLLQYEIMKVLKNKGIEKYYLGGYRLKAEGTKFKGVQNFKKSLGGEVVMGYLWKIDISRLKCFIYNTMLRVKNVSLGVKLQKDYIDSQL